MDKAVKKNLIYFIYWKPENGMLHFNLGLLKRYIDMFDGIRIIKIAVDEPDLDWSRVVPEWLNAKIVTNDPQYNEAQHFRDSLEEIGTDGVTFYAHAKGVSRAVNGQLKWWVELMYKGNLEAEPNLSGNHLFSGCFGKLRPGSVQVPVPWHYTGTFYWFRNAPVIWRYNDMDIPDNINNRWFTENFPGWIARQEEAEFKLYSSAKHKYNCYRQDFWDENKHLLDLL